MADFSMSLELQNLGIEMVPSSPDFGSWVASRYPHFLQWKECFEYCPARHSVLTIEDCTVAYLFSEKGIRSNASRCLGAGLFPLGALPSGCWLVLSTRFHDGSIGAIELDWLVEDEKEIPVEAFRSFDMTYQEWLTLMKEDPGNVEFG